MTPARDARLDAKQHGHQSRMPGWPYLAWSPAIVVLRADPHPIEVAATWTNPGGLIPSRRSPFVKRFGGAAWERVAGHRLADAAGSSRIGGPCRPLD